MHVNPVFFIINILIVEMINSRLIEVEGEKRKGFFSCWNENAKNILER